MPYTNPWSVLIPLGSSPAAQLDSFIQQSRLDLAERINTMIGGAGSMSNDPVIDGITAKSLTQLTTELATKTTVTGLIVGNLVKGNSPTTINSSAYTEAQLAQLLQIAGQIDNVTAAATKFSQILNPGLYFVTFAISSGGNINTLTINSTGGIHPTNNGGSLVWTFPNGVTAAAVSVVLQVLGPGPNTITFVGPAVNTTNSLMLKQIL